MKPVKLPKTLWVTAPGASTNQMTRATILNIAKIRVKNDTTVMVSNLPSKHKLHGQIRNKRNIRNTKRVRTKSASFNNRKRRAIDSLNGQMAIGRTHRGKMGRVRSHMERSTRIKIPSTIPGKGAEGSPEVED
jgi:hypothetical protein